MSVRAFLVSAVFGCAPLALASTLALMDPHTKDESTHDKAEDKTTACEAPAPLAHQTITELKSALDHAQAVLERCKHEATARVDEESTEMRRLEKELAQLQAEYDEFVAMSTEYQTCLESERDELEQWLARTRRQLSSKEAHEAKVSVLHDEAIRTDACVLELTEQLKQSRCLVRQLEQTNDELETQCRVANASIAELEHRVDVLTEDLVMTQLEAEFESWREDDDDEEEEEEGEEEEPDRWYIIRLTGDLPGV
ncbi:hypothetical protein Poli38472_012267 [Pythium oligandrum]|uniref:Uncharacterized protein n=1 Tax=Pythium oligandrum TaxID=41045 RepID=A0A8K1CR48_PYTOL|nr:hypothetical protein Poli38472_012267 [Pythium oligandrum]|eukprot:TMW67151.1 hypothetical protein Poli38472_012267 [Pythium oligandrum]